jgi:hypothetical protein
MENKEKISAFEFAIMEIADPEEAKKYKPLTKQEENEIRVDNLINQAKKLRVKKSYNNKR